MNPKKLITVLLLVFVAGSLGYMIVLDKNSQPAPAPPQPAVSSDVNQPQPNQQLVVYYFHGNVRCDTCRKLETLAKESLDTFFADDLKTGRIKWAPTNVDTPGNEHFIKDYQLVTKSVIVSKIVDGRQVAWQNLDLIWQLVAEKEKYLAYIREGITDFANEEIK